MTFLLEAREVILRLYGKYNSYANMGLKFLFSLVVFVLINSALGYESRINHLAVVLLLAFICAFTPLNVIVVFSAVLIEIHLIALSIEIAIIALILMFCILFLFFRMFLSEANVTLFTVLGYVFKIPGAVSIGTGLLKSPISILSIISGTIMYYFLEFVKLNGTSIANGADESANLSNFNYIIEQLLSNQEMKLSIVTFSVSMIVVYVIRRLSIEYAWEIAIVSGGVINILFYLFGEFALDLNNNLAVLIFGNLLAILIGLVIQFFKFNVDFSSVEMTQFEDDEYYYYVKAVPKNVVTLQDKQVKKISSDTDESDEIEEIEEKIKE